MFSILRAISTFETALFIKIFLFASDSLLSERNPKLFYVSTTVSTISLTTRCYIKTGSTTHSVALPSCLYASPTNGNPNGNTGRRRRRMLPDEPALVPDKPSAWIDDRCF